MKYKLAQRSMKLELVRLEANDGRYFTVAEATTITDGSRNAGLRGDVFYWDATTEGVESSN